MTDTLTLAERSESDNGTWLVGKVGAAGNQPVFRRDDAEGHNDDGRPYDRHWWDYSANEWIDWPMALKRGADPQHRLYEGRVTR